MRDPKYERWIKIFRKEKFYTSPTLQFITILTFRALYVGGTGLRLCLWSSDHSGKIQRKKYFSQNEF